MCHLAGLRTWSSVRVHLIIAPFSAESIYRPPYPRHGSWPPGFLEAAREEKLSASGSHVAFDIPAANIEAMIATARG